jgi:hypothetical protein
VQRVFDGTVAPSDLWLELLGTVLRVVNDEVGVCEELGVTPIGALYGPAPGRQRGRERLVVESVDKRRAIHLEPVAEGHGRVIEVLRFDRDGGGGLEPGSPFTRRPHVPPIQRIFSRRQIFEV